MILPRCKSIGNGAIIGAGSVVTRDVEPYTIVAGNPAKVIRKRFREEDIRKLEDSQWYLLPPDKLAPAIQYGNDVDAFLRHLP